MWGVIPAAGRGARMQPLGFSKELLPLGSHTAGGTERPRAVSEYLLDRMLLGGADKFCFVIASGKSDILNYFGGRYQSGDIAYVVQPEPKGLCDAIFRALPVLPDNDDVLIGLPDTVWFPQDAYRHVPPCALALLLFPVEQPELFDAVVLDSMNRVREVQVKRSTPASSWIWGAIKVSTRMLRRLHRMWLSRGCRDEYLGTLINACLDEGEEVFGFKVGSGYCDVGTPLGYRDAACALDRWSMELTPTPLAGTEVQAATAKQWPGA